MYGFEPGQSVTATGHAALTTTMVTPASANWRRRTSRDGLPAHR